MSFNAQSAQPQPQLQPQDEFPLFLFIIILITMAATMAIRTAHIIIVPMFSAIQANIAFLLSAMLIS